QLGLGQIMHGALQLNHRRDDIDALVHAFRSNRLRTKDAAVRHRKQELDMNRVGIWVIAGMVAGVEVYLLEARHASSPQSLLASACGRNGQAQHTNNRRGLYPAKVRRTSGD